MDAEAKLNALWAADAPPARDARFRLAVLARLEQRRLRNRMAAIGGAGFAALAVTALAAPSLNAMTSSQGMTIALAMGIGMIAWATFTVARRLPRLF